MTHSTTGQFCIWNKQPIDSDAKLASYDL